MKFVVIFGGGFVGINVVKIFVKECDVEVMFIDWSNYYFFQLLFYQVVMVGLSFVDIVVLICSLFVCYCNVLVVQDSVQLIDFEVCEVCFVMQVWSYDYFVVVIGVWYVYFGYDEWEMYVLGFKMLLQVMEIWWCVLQVFESVENEIDFE